MRNKKFLYYVYIYTRNIHICILMVLRMNVLCLLAGEHGAQCGHRVSSEQSHLQD